MAGKKNEAEVYFRDRRAGLLERTGGGYRFTYCEDYLSSPAAEPVSLSLPLTDKPYDSSQLFPFFLGLLPEGWLLDLTSRVLKIDPENAFDMLLATGADCVGAVKVIPIDPKDEP